MDKLKILQIIIYVATFAILSRLFYWQFIAKVESNLNSIILDNSLPAQRGEIYTSDNFPLVLNQQAFLLYGKPQEIKEKPEKIAKNIAPFLISEKYATQESKLSEKELKEKEGEIKKKEEETTSRISNKSLFWVQLARKIPDKVKEKIKSHEIEGLGFEADSRRFYPEASMAAHLLGFVGFDKLGQDTGYFGLEGFYNLQLKGKSGKAGKDVDPFGLPILVGKYRPISPKEGASLHLTLNRTIQFIVEKKLEENLYKYGAKSGSVIVMDPKSGGILAMATYPSYDPAIYYEFKEDLFKNPLISDTFEPGSTFKLITMSAALDMELVTPQTRCTQCSGPRQIGGFEITTWNKKYYPDSTMTEIIEHSDNVGMIFVAEKLGIGNFYEYIKKFGFGKVTGIDLQGGSAGSIREKNDWRPIDLATASFGQGLAVTPVQMIQAVSIIANEGTLVVPRMVEKIVDGEKEQTMEPIKQRRVISAKAASLMTEMMVKAVENGEARAFAPKGYRIAGKTGTAQIPVEGHYDPEKTVASFIGFAPADDPKFAMLVLFNEPSSSPFGSETAAPTFFEIAKEIFNYLGISPSE